jgi:putative salt-induced outer membrane protein YdiY
VGFKFSSIILCAALIAPAAQAQWTGKAELGYLQSSGNAESTSANTKFDL